jgi:predicted nicotinamide N-methyase
MSGTVAEHEAAIGDILAAFHFRSQLLRGDVYIEQEAGRDIGFKLYPGALLLAKWIEDNFAHEVRLKSARRAVELGAGICALPSMQLAAQGAQVVVTDVPEVVHRLSANVALNAASFNADGDACGLQTATLLWGSAAPTDHSAAALLASPIWRQGPGCGRERVVDAAAASDTDGHAASALLRQGAQLDLILGADIVYHEHLITPLLETLLELTDPAGAAAGGDCSPAADAVTATVSGVTPKSSRRPPPVIMSYVQRFKRAKRFFKLASKHFDITTVPMGDVVDYEALTWVLPRLLRLAGEATYPVGLSAGVPAAEALTAAGLCAGGDAAAGTAAAGTAVAGSTWPAPSASAPLLCSASSAYAQLLPLLRRAVTSAAAAQRPARTVRESLAKVADGVCAVAGSPQEVVRNTGVGDAEESDDEAHLKPSPVGELFSGLHAAEVYAASSAASSCGSTFCAPAAGAGAEPSDPKGRSAVAPTLYAAPAADGSSTSVEGASTSAAAADVVTSAAVAEVARLCAVLGIAPVQPYKAYVYIMERRLPGQSKRADASRARAPGSSDGERPRDCH